MTDEDLLNILQLPNLEQLYLFDTEVSPAVVDALDQNQKELEVLMEEEPSF